MKLEFREAKLVKRTQYVGEESTTQVISIRALFTRPLATALRCHDMFFAENGLARKMFDSVKLVCNIEDAEVIIEPPSNNTYLGTVNNFSVGHPKEKSETDPSLEISLSLKMAMNNAIGDWFDDTNKQTFILTVKPPETWQAQEELDLQPAETANA